MTNTPFQIAVHLAYSPIASMNYKWAINLHDRYPLFQVMTQEGYITPSLHILKHDLSSLAPPKGEMKSSFSWTCLFKSPTASTLCFGEPILGKLCSISSNTLWDPTLAKLNQEIKISIPLFVTHLFILELHSLCQALLLKQTEFPTATPA